MLGIVSCAQEADFKASRSPDPNAVAAANAADGEVNRPAATQTAKVEDGVKAVNTTTVITNNTETVIKEFRLGKRESLTDLFQMPASPFNEVTVEQVPAARSTAVFDVMDRGARQATFAKVAPTRTRDVLEGAIGSRPMDMYLITDDSETTSSALRVRMQDWAEVLVTGLYAYDLRIFIGGLVGANDDQDRYEIRKDNRTLPELIAAVRQAILDMRSGKAPSTHERVFRSLNRLTTSFANNDRNDAAKVFFLLTDAPNCVDDGTGLTASSCSTDVNSEDHHSFLRVSNNSFIPDYARRKAVFGAAYKKSRPTGSPCGDADPIETRVDLFLKSQYAQAALDWQKMIEGNGVTTPSYIYNLCSVDPDTTGVVAFIQAAKDVADRRLILTQTPDNFPNDVEYNLAVTNASNTAVPFTLELSRLVKLQDDPAGSTITATHHKTNTYDRLVYAGILNPSPEAGTVKLSWGTTGAEDCVAATSFTALAADVQCRHDGTNLILRNRTFLPTVEPENAVTGTPSSVTVTVKWFNVVPKVRKLTIDAQTSVHMASIAFEQKAPGSDAIVAAMSRTPQTGDASRVDIISAVDLPPGRYVVKFEEDKTYYGEYSLPAAIVDGQADHVVRCYLMTTSASEMNGRIFLDDATATYPCTFHRGANKVTYAGKVPLDTSSQKRLFHIAYLARQDPRSTFALRFPPIGKVTAYLGNSEEDPSKATALGEAEYSVDGNTVITASPLAPGMEIRLEYETQTPVQPRLVIDGSPVKGANYDVTYSFNGTERKLVSGVDFEIRDDDGIYLVLEPEYLVANATVYVKYKSIETSTTKKG